MTHQTIRKLLLRELRSLRREVEAYPDDATLWRTPPGVANPGGTLVLHLTANLQHFVGATLGGSGYVRDREAEFVRRNVPRDELLAEVDRTLRTVDATLASLPPERLDEPFPVPVAGRTVSTLDFLMHLVAHLAYHLGQLDYHRRIVAGGGDAVGAVSVAELAGDEA